ncbi:MAG TPA: hypothetical protein VHM25_28680 [Polyangiaceae bacterium]|jgi:hypothetical protein|nr:hypothetical protein [Polyangiaceae bacterium]
MQITDLARRLLKLVFSLSSASGVLTRPRLERRLEVSAVALNDAIEELGRLGLLDAQRLRLTLSGLACAVACGARSAAKRRSRAVAAKIARANASPVPAPIALFSQREAPRAVA